MISAVSPGTTTKSRGGPAIRQWLPAFPSFPVYVVELFSQNSFHADSVQRKELLTPDPLWRIKGMPLEAAEPKVLELSLQKAEEKQIRL